MGFPPARSSQARSAASLQANPLRRARRSVFEPHDSSHLAGEGRSIPSGEGEEAWGRASAGTRPSRGRGEVIWKRFVLGRQGVAAP